MTTIDIRFESEIKKGADLNDPNSPHLAVFEGAIPHVGEFQSMEVGIFRDGKRKHSIGLYSFAQTPKGNSTLVKFQFNDMRRKVIKHAYKLEAMLHCKSNKG